MSAATVAQKPADEPQQLGSIDQSRTAAYLQDSLTPGTFRIGPKPCRSAIRHAFRIH